MASTYLIEGDGLFLVDTGFVGHSRTILRAIRSIGRHPGDLRLVVVTHPHLDHFGGLAGLRESADFAILCHPGAATAVAEGGKEFSPGLSPWTRWVEWLARTSLPYLTFRGATPVTGIDHGTRLHDYGLPGRILHTPGHTDRCVTLVLDDGTAFTGDLAQGGGLRDGLPAPPSMAVSTDRAVESWRMLLEAGAHTFLPGHGRRFNAEELRRALARAEAGSVERPAA